MLVKTAGMPLKHHQDEAMVEEFINQAREFEGFDFSTLDRVAKLDLSEELTTYAGQQKEIAELQLQGIAPQKDLLDEIETLYDEGGKPSEAELEKLFMEVEPSGADDPLAAGRDHP